ncbi:MAG: SpoIVB peptidase [Desulfotomaculaceae bacterium]|nr:SpoIVB peptidase [Desulfotomaculaceae bacterium]
MRGKTYGFIGGILILLSVMLTYQVQGTLLPPEKHLVTVGQPLNLKFPAPLEKGLKLEIVNSQSNALQESVVEGDFISGSKPVALNPGQLKLRLSLYGVVPVRDMLVSVVPELRVVPGGQSIGVLIHARGIIVAGAYDVVNHDDQKINPASLAGIKQGDVILQIDGLEMRSNSQLKDIVARTGAAGGSMAVEVKRGNETFSTTLNPVLCKETSDYRVGLMTRDSAAGVGTITFYEPGSKSYGALGHVITDVNSSQPVDLQDGKIVGSRVQGIAKGKRGQPGEKIGILQGDKSLSGTISKNTKLGIFGNLEKPLQNPVFTEPIPVAMTSQIHEGPAEILTVLSGDNVEKFSVEILKISPQVRQDGKALVIKITDERLLEKTGGIIQGMSGSPIIQEERLIGAITHVFVNDPTRGYGVSAEWMLEESGLLDDSGQIIKEPAA